MNNINQLDKRSNYQLTYFTTGLLFVVVTVISYIVQYPNTASLTNFMFGDPGAALKSDYLVNHGYLPTIDFGYIYGLLPLSIGHLWFTMFGRNPESYLSFMLVFNILMAINWTRIAISADINRLGIVFLAVAIPFSFTTVYPNLTHAIEAFLICMALGEHISGRKSYALVCLTIACFVKPTMSYLYIFFILITYIINYLFTKKNRLFNIVKEIIPASLTALFLCILLGINFGITPIINSILPISGAKVYKNSNFGFFASKGRFFWDPHYYNTHYYLGTTTGFWFLTSIILILFVAYFYFQVINKQLATSNYHLVEVLSCILFLHLSFVILFFGHSGTWRYYSYLLPIGIGLIASRKMTKVQKLRNFILLSLIPVLIIGYYSLVKTSYIELIGNNRPRQIFHLWYSPDYDREFMDIVKSCKKNKVLIFSPGAMDLFFPQCSMPDTFYVDNGQLNKLDIERINKQFHNAEEIIVPNELDQAEGLLKIDAIKSNLEKLFVIYKKSKYFWFLKPKT